MKGLFSLLLIAFIPTLLIAFEGCEIKGIKVLGNQRISSQTIDSYIKLRPDRCIQDDDLDLVVKELYKTNLFMSVNAYTDQEQNLIIKVQENPLINKVILQGNRLFTNERLLDNVIKLRQLTIFTETKLQSDLINLIATYRNNDRIGVQIKHELIILDSNRVDVVFKIEEGKTSKIKSVRFIGNENFSEDDLVQVIKTHSRNLFSKLLNTILGNDRGINQYLAINSEQLNNFYVSKGYIDNDIQSIIEIDDNYQAHVTFVIDEGEQYLLGANRINIAGGEFDELNVIEEISKLLKEWEGLVFNATEVNNTVQKMTKSLHEKGYMLATVDPEYVKNNNIIDINYNVIPGEKTYINKIIIDGNDRTWDQVIRGKLSVTEGDPYNASEISRSQRKLMNSDFFSSVKINKYKVDNNSVNLNIKVKEKGTTTLYLSGATETLSWPFGICFKGELRQPNVFGSGHEFSGVVEKSKNLSSADLKFSVNNLNDSDTSLDIGTFYEDRIYTHSDFSNTKLGFLVKLSYKMIENLTHSIYYYYKDEHTCYIKNNDKEHNNDKKHNKDGNKERDVYDQISAMGFKLEYNKLDNVYSPSNGYLLRWSEDISGFGGNVNFLKSEFLSFLARPVLKSVGDNTTLRLKMGVGYVYSYTEKKLGVSQHFFQGSNDIRGFDVSGIGPRDKDGDSLGGKFYLNATQQIDFPLPRFYEQAGMKGSLFIDYAMLCSADCEGNRCGNMEKDNKLFRISPGFGFSIPSPLGRIRLDFGFPVVKESYDKILSPNVKISIESGV